MGILSAVVIGAIGLIGINLDIAASEETDRSHLNRSIDNAIVLAKEGCQLNDEYAGEILQLLSNAKRDFALNDLKSASQLYANATSMLDGCDVNTEDTDWVADILNAPTPTLLMTISMAVDVDHDAKGGGKDPLVFGEWDYLESKAIECETEHKFDFDNDGFVENFCYDIVGSMFVIDFNNNGNIDNGAEMLNFYRTSLEGYTPASYIQEYPNVCNEYDCYLWTDNNLDWESTANELEEFSFEIDIVRHYPDGKKLADNGKYAYCAGESVNGETFYCLQPTYWMKGILAE